MMNMFGRPKLNSIERLRHDVEELFFEETVGVELIGATCDQEAHVLRLTLDDEFTILVTWRYRSGYRLIASPDPRVAVLGPLDGDESFDSREAVRRRIVELVETREPTRSNFGALEAE